MGYLDNNQITVDAILTLKGRELLAAGQGVNITQFALADDEVDYSLYNTAHPLGSNYYASAIENMPLVEASPDETQLMKYKLVTLPRGTAQIPQITIGIPSVSLLSRAQSGDSSPTITPTTAGSPSTGGYTALLYNGDVAILTATGGTATGNTSATLNLNQSVDISKSVVQVGNSFVVTAVPGATEVITTQLRITDNVSGATITIPVTITPAS